MQQQQQINSTNKEQDEKNKKFKPTPPAVVKPGKIQLKLGTSNKSTAATATSTTVFVCFFLIFNKLYIL